MIIVVMGVAGSGKTLIGRMLADELGWPFLDADDLHPPANIAKMAAGIPLDDRDRIPWLDATHAKLLTMPNAVLACSALKESYRQRLSAGLAVRFVFLRASRSLITERLRERKGHFFAPELIDSQFDAIEPPRNAIEIDAAKAPDEIVREIYRAVSSPAS
jgi:gluconokinase